jgi:TRAP-type uncharacterized transport system substrate-binding protein
VIDKKVDMAMVNPSSALLQAYRGMAPFKEPHPVRLIAVMPSEDQFVFAVRPDTALVHVEDIAGKQAPLRVSFRGARDHCMHDILSSVMLAAGFSIDDVLSWGGSVVYDGAVPRAETPRFRDCVEGKTDALFDEGAQEWLTAAIDNGLTILSLRPETVERLEAAGLRRAVLRKAEYPGLNADVLTIEFSGWPIFVHADLPAAKVRAICASLDTRRHLIPWEGEGALPIETMVRDTPAGPHFVPLHSAAEAYWRERGYI